MDTNNRHSSGETHQDKSCKEPSLEKSEDTQTSTFPGQQASFRILEVFKNSSHYYTYSFNIDGCM